MKGGLIGKVGTPDEVYNHPRTSYVAGFIGSPTMNLVPVEIDGDAREAVLRLPDGRLLPLPPAQHALAAGARGRPVLMGLRPEDFHAETIGGPALDVEPDVIEPLGSDTLVFFSIGGAELVARLPPRHVQGQPGRLTLHLDPTKLHLFDAGSGRALGLEAAGRG